VMEVDAGLFGDVAELHAKGIGVARVAMLFGSGFFAGGLLRGRVVCGAVCGAVRGSRPGSAVPAPRNHVRGCDGRAEKCAGDEIGCGEKKNCKREEERAREKAGPRGHIAKILAGSGEGSCCLWRRRAREVAREELNRRQI
jgi:hypothetical protein